MKLTRLKVFLLFVMGWACLASAVAKADTIPNLNPTQTAGDYEHPIFADLRTCEEKLETCKDNAGNDSSRLLVCYLAYNECVKQSVIDNHGRAKPPKPH